MTMNEHESAGNLMNLLAAGLTPFVEKELKTAYGDDWTDYTKATWRNGAMHWDISSLVAAVLDQWNSLFGKQLTPSVRSLFYEIRDWRNTWAHQHLITADDLYRISDSAERLLLAISSQEAEKIKQFKSEILQAISENQAQLRIKIYFGSARDIGGVSRLKRQQGRACCKAFC